MIRLFSLGMVTSTLDSCVAGPRRDGEVMEDHAMTKFDQARQALVGRAGTLPVRDDDEMTRKLCMLLEGECEGLGPTKAAQKFGFSKQRYFQVARRVPRIP